MPSAYLLARDRLEQARAILANEVWFDTRLDDLLKLGLLRLYELEYDLHAYESGPAAGKVAVTPFPLPGGDRPVHKM